MTLSSASISAMNNNFAVANNDNDKTKSGTFDSLLHGEGTFDKMVQDVNGQKTVDKTITYADGTTKTTERTITINDDGSKTITKTGKNGKTTTVQEAAITNTDGSTTVTKQKTLADGSVIQTTISKDSMNGETDAHIVRTNADGQTETLDRTSIKDGHTRTRTTTGTGYDGNPIYNESTWTTTA